MKPLLKWTWWKFDEYKFFKDFIPKNINTYIEPFFWWGWVFFQLQPKKSIINDKSNDLIQFYNKILDDNFHKEILEVLKIWNYSEDLKYIWIDYFKNKDENKLNNYQFNTKYINDDLKKELIKSLIDKKKRISLIEEKNKIIFSWNELFDHIETALKSWIYMYFRWIINKKYKTTLNYSAVWFFVREFCYASMFRYNKNWEFNVPYGWISYNKKDILSKINAINSEDVKKLFINTTIYNLDFEDFFKSIYIDNDDFIFLDPPYDSEFSSYDNNEFNKSDQLRLRNLLKWLTCKWMVVIKNTDYIYNLYKEFNIIDFDKTYMYDVKGRNKDNKNVKHLIITNY